MVLLLWHPKQTKKTYDFLDVHRKESLKNNDSIKLEKEQLIFSGKEKPAKNQANVTGQENIRIRI